MYDLLLMHIFKASYEAGHEEARGDLIELSVPTDMVSKVSTREVVHHEVKVFAVLESIVHVDDVNVVQLGQNLAFIND